MAFPHGVVIYINGVRFDPISAYYQADNGGHYNFSVDVPAVPEWDILPARSHGALFFIDPVTKTWRFMCEGEYVSCAKSKSATGQRARTLYFRSIFGWWSQATYTSLCSMVSAPNSQDLINGVTYGTALGKKFTFDLKDRGDPKYRIESLQALIDFASGGDKSIALSAFFPLFVEVCAIQTPVEAFYMVQHRLNNKMHSFPDKEIETIIGVKLFSEFIRNGANESDLQPETVVENIIQKYEDLAFYQRKVLPAPFTFESGTKIMELMWTPQLYAVMPPICNIIFESQVIMSNEQRNLMAAPTRVVATIKLPEVIGSSDIPFVYMANENSVINVANIDRQNKAKNASLVMTHDLLSEEERIKGVIAAPISIGLEKAIIGGKPITGPPSPTVSKALEIYIEEACKHHFFVEKTKVNTVSVSCSFLPYAVPGFPCLIEDINGPIFGIISSVTHAMGSKAPPTTTLEVSHVRPVFMLENTNHSPILPQWINKMFRIENLDKTYTKILSINTNTSRNYSSMSKGGVLSDHDVAASQFVSVPLYTDDLKLITDGYDVNTVSSQLAKKSDPALAYYQHQYRDGMSLSQWAKFHGLKSDFKDEATLANVGLPVDLLSTLETVTMFAHPNKLEFIGVGFGVIADFLFPKEPTVNDTFFGIYEVIGGYSFKREQASKTIAAAIARGISAH